MADFRERNIQNKGTPQHRFKFCEDCPLSECELAEEYTHFQKIHPEDQECELTRRSQNTIVVEAKVLSENEVPQVQKLPLWMSIAASELQLSYDPQQEGCSIRQYIYPLDCGSKWVADGIGDSYKVQVDADGKITKSDSYFGCLWSPITPVFISAQTGKGKNTFVEERLIPYVRELSISTHQHYKVLILSNRLALKWQIELRLSGNSDSDDDDECICLYNKYADVMTYQGLLRNYQHLKQKKEEKEEEEPPKYLYVICDEAHFFTSDASFNPHTKKILSYIPRLFRESIRIYMSATPYDCLRHIYSAENSCVLKFYHFKRDYSYLKTKAYSSITELYDLIVRSIKNENGSCNSLEKWLIFIDDREKCEKVKRGLEEYAERINRPLFIGDKEDKNRQPMVYAVNAASKRDDAYMRMVQDARLDKDTYVLITTSVLDNGVNLTGIKNVVVSDMSKVKCLQMLGRARVSGPEDYKTLYVQRFDPDYVQKRINVLQVQEDAYHDYDLAYNPPSCPSQPSVSAKDRFLDKYIFPAERLGDLGHHLFGRNQKSTMQFADKEYYLNEIARSMIGTLISEYRAIYAEMVEEAKTGRIGQKYLEHQLSWFGKTYCIDDDITFADKEKAKKDFVTFLEFYAENREQIEGEESMNTFQKKFTELYDAAFSRADKNIGRNYKFAKMNSLLEERSVNYMIEGKPQKGPWTVTRFNWEDDHPES